MPRTIYMHSGRKDHPVYVDLGDKKSEACVLEVQIVDELARCGFDGQIVSGSFFGRDKTENGFSVKERVEHSDGMASYDTVCFVWGTVESGILTEVYGRCVNAREGVPRWKDIYEGVNFREMWNKVVAIGACKKL